MITHFTIQLFFYTYWYSIGGLGFIDTVKVWRQTTGKTTIQWILTIFEHWVLAVKSHFLHTFYIFGWNLKHFKCICILSFVMPLIYFPVAIRFTCAKISSIQSISIPKQRCDLADWPWNLIFLKLYFHLIQLYSNPFNEALSLVHVILVSLPFDLCYFWQ